MGTNNIIMLCALYIFFSCGKCEEDRFGEKLELIVPINTMPGQDTFSVGDTLWLEANFSKEVGRLEYLPLSTLAVYPITYVEDSDGYKFMAGVIFKEKGLFLINFNTDIGLFESPNYEHPALYTCEGNRREQVIVRYRNQSTSMENYTSLFRKTKVEYLLQLVDFEEYKNQGCITVVVL